MNTTNQKISRRDAESAEKTWAKKGAEPQAGALSRMTPEPQRKNTVPAPLARKRAGQKWLALWGALIAGFIGCLVPMPFGGLLGGNFLHLLLLPFSAIIVAALGPFTLAVSGVLVFRLQAGTWGERGAFLFGVPLLYAILIWGLCRWWKTETPRARLLGGLAFAAYNALVTFCILYLAGHP